MHSFVARFHRPIFIAVLFVVLLTIAGMAKAQTFKLNEPQSEETIICFVKQAAIDLADAGKGGQGVLFAHMKAGTCFVAQGVFIYTHRVHRNGDYRVYAGRMSTVPMFSPTTWVAENEKEL